MTTALDPSSEERAIASAYGEVVRTRAYVAPVAAPSLRPKCDGCGAHPQEGDVCATWCGRRQA